MSHTVRFRRWLLLLAVAVLLLPIAGRGRGAVTAAPLAQDETPPWPTQRWTEASPEEYGLDSDRLADSLLAIQARGIPIHSLVLIRDGRLLLDATFYPYDGATVHELASVTKSVMTTLIAIAADQGKLDLDQPMLSFFPDRAITNRDARKERITVRHLTGMASGLACTAEHDEQTLDEMRASADWTQFVLDRPMMAEPGSVFVYCSPGMHLLSAILQQATGQTTLDFARAHLFTPLGISDALWPADAQGVTHGWAELYLRPLDAAKLGYLWLQGGQWEGRQVVPRAWVEASVQPLLPTGGENEAYGYGWWVERNDLGGQFAAVGRGGQRVIVLPALNLIVATTGGGFELDDALDLIRPALVDPTRALPANAAAVARLRATLPALRQPPAARPTPPLPALARQISGQTYTLEPNGAQLATVRLDFDDSDAARVLLTFRDGQPAWDARIGLDGVLRFSPGKLGLPAGYRGGWTSNDTFAFELETVANRDAFRVQSRFVEGRIFIAIQERTRAAPILAEGQAPQT